MTTLLFLLLLSGLVLDTAALPSPGVAASWAFRDNATWTYSHSSSFIRLPSGALLAVFQASQSHEGGPTQAKFLVKSTDNGVTWSAPSVLIQVTNASGTEMLPWDGSIFLDSAGLVRCVYVTSPYTQTSAGDVHTISSSDEGATWSAPSVVFPQSVWGRSMANVNPPVQLRGGALALPVYTVPGRSGESGPVTFGLVLVGGDAEEWTPLGVVPGSLGFTTFIEAAVARCAPPLDDQLLALLRTNIGELWAARSTDSGASWSVPYQTPFRNPDSKVNLLQWSGPGAGGGAPADGDLVLTLNPNATWGPTGCNASQPYCPRTPLAMTVSRDCGGSWGPLYNVEVEGDGENSFGYPTARQCSDAGGAPAICLTYSVGAGGTYGGIRFANVPAGNLV